ncbi:VOC family protein [Gorillibacterium timonense]|uniref:VOC family protein n=1 Tax=Gorillibacterium timonense TaxID=1689269 RepID=UPI00071DA2D5|nr:VOC family protein [Gorillibacterium timonense]
MKRYDNFFLGVDNLGEAQEFYGQVLGLELKFNFAEKRMAAFNVGEEEPAIILKEKSVYKDVKPTIWFVVEDVHTECKKLADRGVEFLSEPFSIMTGMAVEFEDPFGNRLGITDYSKQIQK